MQPGHRLPAGLLGLVRRAALEALTLAGLVSALQNLYILARLGRGRKPCGRKGFLPVLEVLLCSVRLSTTGRWRRIR